MTSFHRTEHTIIWTRYAYDLLFLNDEIYLAGLLYENLRFRPNLSKKHNLQDESSHVSISFMHDRVPKCVR